MIVAIVTNGISGFGRFQNYYTPYLLICFVNMIDSCLFSSRKIFYTFCALILTLYFSFVRISIFFTDFGRYSRYDLYFPYSSIVDESNNKNYDYRMEIFREAQNGGTSENKRK